MVVKPAIAGATGADVDQPLTAKDCQAFVQNGDSFVIRYIPRTAALAAGNLTAAEIQTILTSGLALSVVQHCHEPDWIPTIGLGLQYGQYAAQYAKEIGLPNNTLIWLDLEGVSSGATERDVIVYCKDWFSAVTEGGFIGGVYIGWATGLSDDELYHNLPFVHYWKAYNCDQSIPVRGWQLIQHPQQSLNGIVFDPNTVQADEFGDLPMFIFNS
jgi:hypothetical protein